MLAGMDQVTLEQQIRSLEAGRAFVEHSDVSLTLVSGSDARGWLNDLVTADVASLERTETRPSLLLTPTGRIRAAFHVLGLGDGTFLLAQPDGQPTPVADLLTPYVLSSDVVLEPAHLRIFSVPGGRPAPTPGELWRPSIDGDGFALLVDPAEAALEELRGRLRASGLLEAGFDALEARRIRRGLARFPVDLDEDSLPAEADLEALVDFTKGCFLGQESLAKVRNLGHPPRVVLALRAGGSVAAGQPVLDTGAVVGSVTSATAVEEGSALIARVRWEAREAALATTDGVALRPA